MKKSTLCLCAGILALGLTACGGSPEDGSESGNGSSQGTEQTEGTGSSGTESEGSDVSGEENTESDVPGEEFTGIWSDEMAGLRAAVVEAVGEKNYWPDAPMDPEMFQTLYQVSGDTYEDYMAESPMISANVDTLIIVKAKEGQADAVYDALSAYRENLVNDTMQYPMNLGKIQASRVEKTGNYVIFVQLGGETPDDEEAAITQCREANDKALEAIRGMLEQ